MDHVPSSDWDTDLRNRHIEQLADLPVDYEPIVEQESIGPGSEGTDTVEQLFEHIQHWIERAKPQLRAAQDKSNSRPQICLKDAHDIQRFLA
jgi:hypothetical protein